MKCDQQLHIDITLHYTVHSEKRQPVAEVGGDQIHSVPMISTVGGDASHGAHGEGVAPSFLAAGQLTVIVCIQCRSQELTTRTGTRVDRSEQTRYTAKPVGSPAGITHSFVSPQKRNSKNRTKD